MAPGGGGGSPPPGKGGPPDDRKDDESDKEKDEEEDTDEETESVTSTSQVSAHRGRPLIWGNNKGNIKDNGGGPPEDPDDPSEEGHVGDGRRGPRGHRGQRGRTGPPGRDGAMGPVGPIGPRGFLGRDGLSTTGGPLTSTGLGNTSYFQCKFEHHWYGKFVPLFRRVTESCNAISTKCESKHGRTPKYDRQKSITPRTSTGAIGGEHPTKGI